MVSTGERRPLQLRPMRCEVAYLQKADGSCSFSQGRTTVWASCSGPGDVHISRRENDKMHLDVSFRQTSGDCQHHKFNGIISAALSSVVNLTLFPRTTLTVTVHSLQADGSVGAAALTAASLSLLDNGIPISAPFCGVLVVRTATGDLIVDPDAKTEQAAVASFLFALRMDQSNADGCCVVGSDCVGPFTVDDFSSAYSLAAQAARQIFDFFKETMQRKLSIDALSRT